MNALKTVDLVLENTKELAIFLNRKHGLKYPEKLNEIEKTRFVERA